MELRVAAGAVGALSIALLSSAWALGSCSGGPGVVAPAKRPNVLIVLWDTVRADRMSVYGYDRPTTPRLEALAKEGAVYERATAPGMWTLPSHASMFTGLYETSHGAKPGWRWLDEQHTTLAEVLSGQGYDTFAFSANLIASPMTNLTQGFETIHTTFPRAGEKQGRYVQAAKQATRAKVIAEDASTEISPAFAGNATEKWGKSVHKDAAPVAHRALTDWLDERPEKDKPFFAYVNLMEAHTPRIPSMSARRRVMDDASIRLGLQTDASLYAENEYIVGKREYTPEQLAAIGGIYDAALVDLDDATGDLVDDLRARGVLDDTLLIVVADHGEGLGEHRLFEHRWSVYEQLLSVPLVIRYPAKVPAGRVEQRVSTADLFATVLDAAGTEAPGPTNSHSLLGRKEYDRFVFSQMLDPFASQLRNVHKDFPDLDLSPWLRTYCVAYQGDEKLVYASDGAHRLFDLAKDAAELVNLYADAHERAEVLEGALTTWEAGLATYDPGRRLASDGARDQGDEEGAMLKLLGYAEDDEGDEVHAGPLRDRCGPPPTR